MDLGGRFWLGIGIMIFAALNLWWSLHHGKFDARRPFAPIDRAHPIRFRAAIAAHIGSILLGLYFALDALSR